jgi:glycosyltransferase involved in cell wall biosynthesis
VLRSQIGCSKDDWIVVCVSAWNRHHKRIDYLIDEVAQMNNKRVQLVMCGHPEPDTPVLKKMAQEKLPNRVHWLTLGQKEVQEVLQAADVYVLPSINEALGNSMIEAAFTGVPIVAHEHSASKFLLQEPHRMTDLSQSGNLSKRLLEIMQSPPPAQELAAIRERARSLFSREALMPRYCEMVKLVSGMPPFSKHSQRSTVGNYDFGAEN